MLSQTETLNGNGIINIYHRELGVTLALQNRYVSSPAAACWGWGFLTSPLVEGVRGLNYGPPVATMRAYLKKMTEAPYTAVMPEATPKTVIAALGPKMLELAAIETAGAHPYFSSPDHTAMARKIMGPDAWLCPEQKVILESDPGTARELARPSLAFIKTFPIIGTTGFGWLN